MFAASFLLPVLFAQAQPAAYPKAAVLFERRDFSGAPAALDDALRENPRYLPALLLEARLSIVNGQMNRAPNALETAVSEKPATSEPRFLLGFVFYLENDFERADATLASADRKDARVLLYGALSAEGLCLLESGQYPEAVRLGERALAAPGMVPSERGIRYLPVRAWQKAVNTARERALFEKLPMPLVR